MVKRIGLQNEYIKVRRKEGGITFGGDQNFYACENPSEIEEKKKACGCGIIALADLVLYLAGKDSRYLTEKNRNYVNRELSEAAYREYFDFVYDFVGGIFARVGISGIRLFRRFNRMSKQNGWKLRAGWGLSRKKLLPRIEEMLKSDIPVILCVPFMLRRKDKEDKLPFYKKEYDEQTGQDTYVAVSYVSAHYVTVTEMFVERDGEVYLKVSSWGKEYYIRFSEYDTYINTHFLGKILGNILYIRPKES